MPRELSLRQVGLGILYAGIGLYLLHGLWLGGWSNREDVQYMKALATACEQMVQCRALAARAAGEPLR